MMPSNTSVVGINFSPRPDSNSNRLLVEALDRLKQDEKFFVVGHIDLASERIDCMGCESCYKTPMFHNDGVDRALKVMMDSDVVLIATPTYFGMPPALGVVLLNRSDALWRGGHALKDKVGAVIVNGATEPIDDPSVKQCGDNICSFFAQHGMITVESVCVGGTLSFSDQRYPNPLPEHIADAIKKLISKIQKLSQRT